MLIKEIKKENRPVEKMLRFGPEALTNEELLAILINTGTKNKSSLDISYDIINSVSSLADILSLSLDELQKFEGIKETKACRIEASFELTRRLLSHKGSKIQIITTFDSVKICYPRLAHLKQEKLLVLFVDAKCNLISTKIYDGEVGSVFVPQNLVLREALLNNARGIILAHNHPSGDPTPSRADYESTVSLDNALKLLNLILFDHIVIGDNSFYSIVEDKHYHYNLNDA